MHKRQRAAIVFSLLFCLAFTGVIARAEQQPWTQTRNCDWELAVKDTQEYLYQANGETLKKLTTVDIFATKKGGTDYFGRYTGKGVITVFNALSPDEDAYPVLYGGQIAVTKEFKLDFTIYEGTNDMVPAWEFSPLEDRVYDGMSTLQFNIELREVRGIFQYVENWPGLIGSPGIEFEYGSEIAILYTDGGYVSLTLGRHWQIPAPFKGTLIGIPTGGIQPTKKPTQPPQSGNIPSTPHVTNPPAVTYQPPPDTPTPQPPPVTATRRIPDIDLTTIHPGFVLQPVPVPSVIVLPTPTPVVIY